MVIHMFFTVSSSMPDVVAMVATARGRLRAAAAAAAIGWALAGAHETLGMGMRAAANSAALARRRDTVGGEEGEVPVAMGQAGDDVDVSTSSTLRFEHDDIDTTQGKRPLAD